MAGHSADWGDRPPEKDHTRELSLFLAHPQWCSSLHVLFWKVLCWAIGFSVHSEILGFGGSHSEGFCALGVTGGQLFRRCRPFFSVPETLQIPRMRLHSCVSPKGFPSWTGSQTQLGCISLICNERCTEDTTCLRLQNCLAAKSRLDPGLLPPAWVFHYILWRHHLLYFAL